MPFTEILTVLIAIVLIVALGLLGWLSLRIARVFQQFRGEIETVRANSAMDQSLTEVRATLQHVQASLQNVAESQAHSQRQQDQLAGEIQALQDKPPVQPTPQTEPESKAIQSENQRQQTLLEQRLDALQQAFLQSVQAQTSLQERCIDLQTNLHDARYEQAWKLHQLREELQNGRDPAPEDDLEQPEENEEDNGVELIPGRVAVYWDLENVHCSIPHHLRSEESRIQRINRKGQRIVNVGAIMDYIAELGDVVVHRAYANWSRFSTYATDFLKHSVDLVQMFPRGSHAKNGADIRLALDALEDLHHYPHITHVVIIGGDSDYISLAQKIRQTGRYVIGIGAQEATNEYWIESCNIFKLYRTIIGTVARETGAAPAPDPEAGEHLALAREVLIKAVRRLAERRGDRWAKKSGLRSMMQRLDPSFDEANCGFASFGDLLNACTDIIERRKGEHDHMIAVRDSVKLPEEPESQENRREAYGHLLRRQHVRLIPAAWRREALNHLVAIFDEQEGAPIAGWPEMKELLAERLETEGVDFQDGWIAKLKDLFYVSRHFERTNDGGISLKPGTDGERIFREINLALTRRIVSNFPAPHDPQALAEVLFDEQAAKHLSDAEELLETAISEEAETDEPEPALVRSVLSDDTEGERQQSQ